MNLLHATPTERSFFTLVFLRTQSHVALCEKPPDSPSLGGTLAGIEGEIMPGETSKECAIRSVREKFGLSLHPRRTERVGDLRYFHECRTVSTQIYFSWREPQSSLPGLAGKIAVFEIADLPWEDMPFEYSELLFPLLRGRKATGDIFFNDKANALYEAYVYEAGFLFPVWRDVACLISRPVKRLKKELRGNMPLALSV